MKQIDIQRIHVILSIQLTLVFRAKDVRTFMNIMQSDFNQTLESEFEPQESEKPLDYKIKEMVN